MQLESVIYFEKLKKKDGLVESKAGGEASETLLIWKVVQRGTEMIEGRE